MWSVEIGLGWQDQCSSPHKCEDKLTKPKYLQRACTDGMGEQPREHFSQNHRMAEVRRHLWRSSGPTPLLRQGHLQPVAQDCVQVAFE